MTMEENKKEGEVNAAGTVASPDNSHTSIGSDPFAKCETERDEYLRGWQRAKADLANYKKDEAQRLEEFATYNLQNFLREIIAVLDTFDLGIAALAKHGPVEKGMYLIRTQLEDILGKYGVSRIPFARGAPFDPSVAEAIAEEASDLPEGGVIEEIEPGYRLHDKVMRPARVKVSKGKSQLRSQ